MSLPHPRESLHHIGHDATWQQLCGLHAAGKLPHGIILAGPRGIGKATLAYHFIRHLLGERSPAPKGVASRIRAGCHADLMVIEPEFNAQKGEFASEIKAKQARKITSFFAHTSAEGIGRVVLIDSADMLNTESANAILKCLEEPPDHSILLLIAHQPSLLLPTIRSRCVTMQLHPPAIEDFDRIMVQLMPEVDGQDRALLAELTGRAPGLAAEYAEQEAAACYADILEIVGQLPAYPQERIHAFASELVRQQPHTRWRIFTQLMLLLLARAAKTGSGSQLEEIMPGEGAALHTLASLQNPPYWAAQWSRCAEEFSVAARLHLDYKQVIIAFFHSLNREEAFHSGVMAA